MAILNSAAIFSLLKNKLFLLFLGASTIGGVATPVALTIKSSSESLSDEKSLNYTHFGTKDKLKAAVDSYDSSQRPPSGGPNSEDPKQLLIQKEDSFLTAVKAFEKATKTNSNSLKLSKEQRESLSLFCHLYATMESKDTLKSHLIDNRRRQDIAQSFKSSIACDDLEELKGTEPNGVAIKDRTKSNGGGDDGNKNPFRHFYLDSQENGKSKMQRLSLNNSSQDSKVLSELEYDIVSGLLRELERIHTQYISSSNQIEIS